MSAFSPHQLQLLKRLESGEIELPLLLDFAVKVLNQIRAGGSAQDIAPALEKDQVLSAQVLRLANSSFYGGMVPVRSVTAAVVRVGVQNVGNFLTAGMQRSLYQNRNPQVGGFLRDLWRHSLGVATVAQLIGEALKERETGTFFLAGCVHDIGRTALVSLLPPSSDGPWPPHALLEAMHTEAGTRLLARWAFPADVVAAVQFHHEPKAAGKYSRIAAAITLADAMCYRLGIHPEGQEPDMEAAEAEAFEVLGLSEIALADIEVELEDRVAELDKIFAA